MNWIIKTIKRLYRALLALFGKPRLNLKRDNATHLSFKEALGYGDAPEIELRTQPPRHRTWREKREMRKTRIMAKAERRAMFRLSKNWGSKPKRIHPRNGLLLSSRFLHARKKA